MIESLEMLQERMNFVRSAIERNNSKSSTTAAGKTSKFWSEHFADRPNFPDLSELMTFRRTGYGYGIGDERIGDRELERQEHARKHRIFAPMVPAEFVASIPESVFGAPLVFENDGLARSSSFLVNAFTTHRVREALRAFGKPGPLRVLEIGAGWGGCAYQLHYATDVESYMIVDLPENLYLSAMYLSNSLPDRKVDFLDIDGDELTAIAPGTIAVCLPGTIGRTHTKFDLVLNSFSLQEMELESVEAYMDWIDTVLSDDGIFVSLNSHAKAGVQRPSQYGYEKFHVHHWGVFRQRPQGYLNSIPYEVVVSRRRPDSPHYAAEWLNALGWLMQLGLDEDLVPLCRGMVSGNLSHEQVQLLECYGRFFDGQSRAERDSALSAASLIDRSAISPFVEAHVALARRDRKLCEQKLEQARARGLSGFAKVRADVLIAGLSATKRHPGSIPLRDDGFDAAAAYPEVATVLGSGKLDVLVEHARRIVAPYSG